MDLCQKAVAIEIMLETMYVSAIQPDQKTFKWAYFLLNCLLNLQALQSKSDRNCSKKDHTLPSSLIQNALNRLEVIERVESILMRAWLLSRAAIITALCLPVSLTRLVPTTHHLPSDASRSFFWYLLLLHSPHSSFFHLLLWWCLGFRGNQALDFIAGNSQPH